MATIIDSYSESNVDGQQGVASPNTQYGTSFSVTSAGNNIGRADLYLKKAGSPTGNCYAKLYSHTGTYGTDGTPDTLLATSDAFNVATLTTSFQLITFTFTGAEQVALSDATKYFICLEYTGGSAGTWPIVGQDNSSPSHGGNVAQFNGATWSAYSGIVGAFYIYNNVEGSSSNMFLQF